MSKGRLAGKVAIITGAGSGIGQAVAELFEREGANLILNDLYPEKVELLLQSFAQPKQHALVAGDISQEVTAGELCRTALEQFGQIDILVNNAGIHYIKDITEITEEDIDRCLSINLKSMIYTCKAVIPHMQKQKKGSIVNLSSISAYIGQEMFGKSTFLYNMTKAAALQLARSLATRYAADGIRVNAVCPGGTKTGQITEEHTQGALSLEEFWSAVGEAHPIGRVGRPEEIANAVLFLASDESSFMTGSPLVVDGGYLAR